MNDGLEAAYAPLWPFMAFYIGSMVPRVKISTMILLLAWDTATRIQGLFLAGKIAEAQTPP